MRHRRIELARLYSGSPREGPLTPSHSISDRAVPCKAAHMRCFCFLALLLLQHALYALGLSSISSFSDSACTTPHSNMDPNSIQFDAANPQCLLVRNDTLIPTVSSFDAMFYNSAESCRADTPVVVQYASGFQWPATPMPVFPSPFSSQNTTFCFQGLYISGQLPTSALNLTMTFRDWMLPAARASQGLVGDNQNFLCLLGENRVTFPAYTSQQPLITAKAFLQHLVGGTVKIGLPMYSSSSNDPIQPFEKCNLDTCCTTGSGSNTVHFKVPKRTIQYRPPVLVYGKVLSCSSGNLMFQTFLDAQCTTGRNVPWVIKADATCQSTPSPSSNSPGFSSRSYDYGYDSYYRARCDGALIVPPTSITVSGYLDSSCSQPNVDILSPVNCDSTQCCLIAKRNGLNYLDGGIVRFFATSADCQNDVAAHPNNITIVNNNYYPMPTLNISGFPIFGPPSWYNPYCRCLGGACTCPLYAFTSSLSSAFPRKQLRIRCQQSNPSEIYMGYFVQYSGNGKWSFDVRMFSDRNCLQQIYVDPTVPSDRMCPTDTCCRVGNSFASLYIRVPSSMLVFNNNTSDVYGRLLSCDGDVAMFYQYADSACSFYDDSDLRALLPRMLRADGSCSAVPSESYAIDSFYRARCSLSSAPLVQSVSVSAFSDSKCATANTGITPQSITCPVNQCCVVRQATASRNAVYGRALSCNSNVLLFNTFEDSNCIVPNFYVPLALQSDNSCQVDQTGYASFYRASCVMAASPPPSPSPAPPSLACPQDPQGNVCGGSTYGACTQRETPSGTIAVCVCVPNGFFDGKICTSASAYYAAVG